VVKRNRKEIIEHAETKAEYAEAKTLIVQILSHNSITLPIVLEAKLSNELPYYAPGGQLLHIPASLLS
jgi:hypothetical protein